MYLLRTGSGQFGIFDENTFPSPYLQLDTTNSEKLDLDVHDDFKELMNAFDTRQENAGLEHLNACGVYDSLIEKLFGDKKWKLGPRGNKISEFKVFGKTKHDKIIPIYKNGHGIYEVIAELQKGERELKRQEKEKLRSGEIGKRDLLLAE